MIMSLASTPAAMRRSPVATAPAVGLLNARALAALGSCKGDWCKVKAGGVTGWLSTDQVWGLVPAAQCR
jgi:SH3-like domain-containing protein